MNLIKWQNKPFFLCKTIEMFTTSSIYAKMKMEGEWRDMKKYLCEFLGTCVLVLFGCGVAVITKGDLLPTALAFGLSITAVFYTIGKISGCHINPAVSFAMWIDKRITTKDFSFYVVAQILGGAAACGLLTLIFNSTANAQTLEMGANAFGSLSGSGITMLGALILEIILTFVFVLAVLGVTRDEKNSRIAATVIGFTLVLVHLFGIYLTGTSVNPARSLAPTLFLGGTYLEQVWVFIVGPLVGAAFAALAIFFIDLEGDETSYVQEAVASKKEENPVKIVEPVQVKYSNPVKKPKTTKTTTKTKSSKKLA